MAILYINQVLIVCVLLSFGYAFVLEQLHDLYSPNWIWVTVVFGNGFIVATLYYLEWVGIAMSAGLVLQAMIAWGVPIVLWQVWQWKHRRDQLKGM